jgi:hypothetical protein
MHVPLVFEDSDEAVEVEGSLPVTEQSDLSDWIKSTLGQKVRYIQHPPYMWVDSQWPCWGLLTSNLHLPAPYYMLSTRMALLRAIFKTSHCFCLFRLV